MDKRSGAGEGGGGGGEVRKSSSSLATRPITRLPRPVPREPAAGREGGGPWRDCRRTTVAPSATDSLVYTGSSFARSVTSRTGFPVQRREGWREGVTGGGGGGVARGAGAGGNPCRICKG